MFTVDVNVLVPVSLIAMALVVGWFGGLIYRDTGDIA